MKFKKKNLSESKNRDNLIVFLIGAFLGMIIFIAIYGVSVLNPCYDDWIFNKNGDVIQHYIGWQYFRKSDWHFPLGLIDGLSDDGTFSCVYTDSIPIFAIFFKIFSPILPSTFQYIGLWEFLSFILQGGISSIIIFKLSKNKIYSAVCSLFYILSPVLLIRSLRHEALSGQWVILISILSLVCINKEWKHKFTPVLIWILNGMLAAMVHIYFIPMIYVFLLGYVIADIMKNKKIIRPVLSFVLTTVFTLLTMYAEGCFYGKGTSKEKGLGVFSANYNCFFNGQGNTKFMNLNKFSGQQEGFGYLGFGVIILAVISVIIIFAYFEHMAKSKRDIKKFLKDRLYIIIPFILMFSIGFFVAASPKGTLNRSIIYEINYPQSIMNLLSIFRASGRFVWIPFYLVYTFVFWTVSKISKINMKNTMIFTVVFCFLIQGVDLSFWIRRTRGVFAEKKPYVSVLDNNEFNKMAENKEKIVFLNVPESYLSYSDAYYLLTEYAYKNDMTVSSFARARNNYDSIKKYSEKEYDLLKNGKGNDKYIYFFFDENDIPDNINLKIYKDEENKIFTAVLD